MANLIITVISIALIAVAAMMGAFYGGSAFLDGQAKAQANSLIEGAKQIAGAWTMYAADRGGDYTLTSPLTWGTGTVPELVPKYLSSLPSFDFKILPYKYFWPAKSGENLGQTNSDTLHFIALPKRVCEQINFIAKGTATVSTTDWAGWTNLAIAKAEVNPFYCATSIVDGETYYFFRYRVF